jgi:hypothetical protein
MSDVVGAHLMTYKTVQDAAEAKRAWAKQLLRVADGVIAGRYSSPEEAQKALADLNAAAAAPSTLPSEN